MSFHYDPRSEFDIKDGIIPYHSFKHKKNESRHKPCCSATTTLKTSSSSQDLKLSASEKAKAEAEKVRKREEGAFYRTYGHLSSLNVRWESNKSRRIDSRLGDDYTRVQQHEKVQQFLKDCSVDDEDGSGILQWKPKYIEDKISFYLLNALDTATRKTGDLATALVNVVACYSSNKLLPVIYKTFKESKYRFVEVDETQEAFVDRFTRKGTSAKQVFSSAFASHFLEKISSSRSL